MKLKVINIKQNSKSQWYAEDLDLETNNKVKISEDDTLKKIRKLVSDYVKQKSIRYHVRVIKNNPPHVAPTKS